MHNTDFQQSVKEVLKLELECAMRSTRFAPRCIPCGKDVPVNTKRAQKDGRLKGLDVEENDLI